jgi:hypothetical protein
MEQLVFRNVGIYKSDAGESPKRKQTTVFIKFVVLLKFINQLQFWLQSESNEGQLNVEKNCICRHRACR